LSLSEKLSKLQELLVAMQDISLHYDDTQCDLLRKSVQSNARIGATPAMHRPVSTPSTYTPRGYAASPSGTPKPVSRSQALFYRQLVDERRKLDDLQVQIDRIRSTLDEESAGDGEGSALESLVPQFSGGGGGRRKSIKVRSVLESTKPSTATVKRPSIAAMVFERMEPVEDEKTTLFNKSEHDKSLLIEENKRLRDLIITSNPSGADTESRTIINELKAWELERDDLEAKIDHLEDVANSLRERIHNLDLKPHTQNI
jgi:hypothetical protein